MYHSLFVQILDTEPTNSVHKKMLWWANTIKICLKFHEISRWLWNGSFPSKSDRFATWNMAATKTFASRPKTAFMFLGLRRLPADKNQGVILTGQPHWPIRAVLVLCACAVLSNSKLTWQDPTRHKCAWVQPDNAGFHSLNLHLYPWCVLDIGRHCRNTI